MEGKELVGVLQACVPRMLRFEGERYMYGSLLVSQPGLLVEI